MRIRRYTHDGTYWRFTFAVTDGAGYAFSWRTTFVEGPQDKAQHRARVMLKNLWPGCTLRVKKVTRCRTAEQYFRQHGVRPSRDQVWSPVPKKPESRRKKKAG